MAKKEMNKEKKNKNFGKELKSELKKVSWPTLKQLVNNTTAVITIVLIVSAIVFVLDVCFKNLNNFGIGRLKALVSSNTEQQNQENQETTDDVNAENTDNQEGENTNANEVAENGEENTNTEVNSETENVQE